MSTIKSSDEHLTLNADGSSKDIKFQANGVEKASISSAGAFTSTTIDATKLTGNLPAISGAALTGVGVAGITSSADATAITIDSAENVGFGVTPTSFYSGYTGVQVGGNGTFYGQTAAGASNNFWVGQNVRAGTDGSEKAITTGVSSQIMQSGGQIVFKNAPSANADANVSWTTAMQITSPTDVTVRMDCTATPTSGTRGFQYNGGTVHIGGTSTSGQDKMRFDNPNGRVGSIATSGSSTSYNTSSDYRLKENVDYTWDATTRLKQLKPARFNFIADDTNTLVDGFIAHEVSSVVPEAITGEKDAMEAAVLYKEGDDIPEGKSVGDVRLAEQIAAQAIDQSKLVPLLVKTIQELEARITALEA